MLGTPAFMSPEQFTGAPVDGRADLFSLGVILYWLATGEQPFTGETMTTVSYKIVHTEPVPPAKLNPAIPEALEAVILKCLAKSPDDRYQTGEEVAEALAQLRTAGEEPSLQATAPLTRGTANATDKTYDPNFGHKPKPSMATAPLSPQTAAPVRKRNVLPPMALLLMIVAAGVGGYLLRFHHSTAQQPPAPAAAPALPAMPEPAPAPLPAPEAVSAKAPATPAPHTQSAVVPFDPKALDPKENARLKLELDHFPAGLAFTVEMNRQIYLKAEAGDKAALENLFVPPGVQEFRVTVRGGGVQKASNIVSAEFLANKRMTLKVEFRPPANGSSTGEQALDPAAQIVASLKADRLFF
jgi:serine/threonine-protein kinase